MQVQPQTLLLLLLLHERTKPPLLLLPLQLEASSQCVVKKEGIIQTDNKYIVSTKQKEALRWLSFKFEF